MASFKAERTMFIKLAGPAKKEPAKLDDSTSKTTASKPDSEKAAQKPQERKIKLYKFRPVQGYGQTNSEQNQGTLFLPSLALNLMPLISPSSRSSSGIAAS
ncbi:hypothetical protein NC651_020410 [Populus alba x Populus x berolinensis]|nr:hypothetical protein NC651_020410 [Populus alba x Populus x berolinensis]